jgi:hypothetical protein
MPGGAGAGDPTTSEKYVRADSSWLKADSLITIFNHKKGMAPNEIPTPNKICPDIGNSFFSFLHRLQREGAAVGGSQLSAQMVV